MSFLALLDQLRFNLGKHLLSYLCVTSFKVGFRKGLQAEWNLDFAPNGHDRKQQLTREVPKRLWTCGQCIGDEWATYFFKG